MPIRFKCQHCGKPVKAPDGAQGKKSRCPQCSQVISVPQASDPSLAPAQPSAAAAPKSPAVPSHPRPAQPTRPAAPRKPAPQANAPLGLDDLLGDLSPARSSLGVDDLLGADPGLGGLAGGLGDLLDEASYDMGKTKELPDRPAANPYLAPASAGGKRKGNSSGNRNGPAWEGDGATVGSYFSTLIAGYSNPSRFFRTMVRDSGVGAPILFAVVTYLITAVAQMAYAFLLGGDEAPGPNNAAAAGGFAIGYIIGVGVCGTAMVALGLLLMGAFIHVGVLLTGGSAYGIEPSVRAVAYSAGCASALQLIPVVGAILMPLVNLPLLVIGIARLHEMPIWRAILVVIIPYALLVAAAIAVVFALLSATDVELRPQ